MQASILDRASDGTIQSHISAVSAGEWKRRHENPAFEWIVHAKAANLPIYGIACTVDHSALDPNTFSPASTENRDRYGVSCALWAAAYAYMLYYGKRELPSEYPRAEN